MKNKILFASASVLICLAFNIKASGGKLEVDVFRAQRTIAVEKARKDSEMRQHLEQERKKAEEIYKKIQEERQEQEEALARAEETEKKIFEENLKRLKIEEENKKQALDNASKEIMKFTEAQQKEAEGEIDKIRKLRKDMSDKFELFEQKLKQKISDEEKKLLSDEEKKLLIDQFSKFVEEITALEITETNVPVGLEIFEKMFKSEVLKSRPELQKILNDKFIEFIKKAPFDFISTSYNFSGGMVETFVQNPNFVSEMINNAEQYLKESPAMKSIDDIVDFMEKIDNAAVAAKLEPLKLKLEKFRNDLLKPIDNLLKPVNESREKFKPINLPEVKAEIVLAGVNLQADLNGNVKINNNTGRADATVLAEIIKRSLAVEKKYENTHPDIQSEIANFRRTLIANIDPEILTKMKVAEMQELFNVFQEVVKTVSPKEAFETAKFWILGIYFRAIKNGWTKFVTFLGSISKPKIVTYDNISLYKVQKYLLNKEKFSKLNSEEFKKILIDSEKRAHIHRKRFIFRLFK